MPRRENQLPTVQITISTTPQIEAYLEALVETGLYGKNLAESAERIIAGTIADLVDSKRLKAGSRKRAR